VEEPEAGRPGIYILSGEKDVRDTIYVGETDEIRARIKQHISEGKKDWWDKAIFVTATGEPLNKAHARFLESRVYSLSKSIGKVAVENSKAPTESQLSKAATAHMEDFLEKLQLVLPALRFDFLSEQAVPTSKPVAETSAEEITYFVLKTKEVTARAWKKGSSFFVEKGSDARTTWVGAKNKDGTTGTYERLYTHLVSSGVIGDKDGQRVFLKDYDFNPHSPSGSLILLS